MELTLRDTVGLGGQNDPEDVRLLRALLNAHRRQISEPTLPLSAAADPELFVAVARFQIGQGAAVASATIAPQSGAWQALLGSLAASRTLRTIVPPTQGLLTWESEGQEGGAAHSRVLRVLNAGSGVILGRGYDMRERMGAEVQRQLLRAGLCTVIAGLLASAVRLHGRAAEHFVIHNDLLDFELSPSSQLRLFETVYAETVAEVQRICAKPDLVGAYGAVYWAGLDRRMKDVLVDLHCRGDYSLRIRRLLQPSLARNDIDDFRRLLAAPGHWPLVPMARFARRNRFLA